MPTTTLATEEGVVMQDALNLQGIQILAVDDEVDNLELLAFILEQAGANVMSASSAKEALEILSQFKPDMLIADIGMPHVDGYTLLRQIRSLPPDRGGQILAIALTAYAGEIDQKQALAAGFQLHIAKPVEPDELVRAIAKLLKRNDS